MSSPIPLRRSSVGVTEAPKLYTGPRPPVVYDRSWQLYTNLTIDDIAFYMAQPEWQNFVAWVALDPPNATIHANAPDMTTIVAALTAANVTAMPLGVTVNPTPVTPVAPTIAQPLSPAKPL